MSIKPGDQSRSLSRRSSQVYVEISSSSLAQKPRNLGSLHVANGDLSHKENTPLRPSGSMSQVPKNARKRKLSGAASVYVHIDSPSHKAKKAKTGGDQVRTMTKSTKSLMNKSASAHSQAAALHTEEESFYCHQCNKKRECSIGLQCTFLDKKGLRCKAKFCKPCLKNRYGESIDDIKASGENIKSSERALHVRGQGFLYKCPKCKDICNCVRCRKAKGLEPTGNLTIAARKNGASAADILQRNPHATGILPGKGRQIEPEERVAGRKKGATDVQEHEQSSKPKPKGRPRQEIKPPVPPKWKKVPTNLTLDDAQMRFNIREFMLRFAPILDISNGHLDELEEIGSGTNVRGRHQDEDEDDVTPWIPEITLKSIIIALLQLFADEHNAIKKCIKDAMKEVRASGANLQKIWVALSTFRSSIESVDKNTLAFPDPLPPPSTAKLHNTRGAQATIATGTGVVVLQSAQMVPVLSAFIEAALDLKVVRNEIDEGVKEAKERTREARELIKKGNERWEEEKGKLGDGDKLSKERRQEHKQAVLHYENALKVVLAGYIPRCGPLGIDRDGRVYWALLPGAQERNVALEFLREDDEKSKRRKRAKIPKKLVPDEAQREAFKRWSWFVVVWGRKPHIEAEDQRKAARKSSEDSSDEEESDDKGWWGFGEPAEILKLADWIQRSSGLSTGGDAKRERGSGDGSMAHVRELSPLTDVSDEDDDEKSDLDEDMAMSDYPSVSELRTLVKGLQDYASLLNWRLSLQSVHDTDQGGDTHTSAKDGARVSASNTSVQSTDFYH